MFALVSRYAIIIKFYDKTLLFDMTSNFQLFRFFLSYSRLFVAARHEEKGKNRRQIPYLALGEGRKIENLFRISREGWK